MKTSLILAVFFCFRLFCQGQDYLVRTNGSKIPVRIVEIDGDLVKYRDYQDKNSQIIFIEKNQLKYIEYENGEVKNFYSAYRNTSGNDSIQKIKQIEIGNDTVYLEGIKVIIENLFHQNILYLDFEDYPDSTFTAGKGKMIFNFENSTNSEKVNFFPKSEKRIYSTFDFTVNGSKKTYLRLKDEPLTAIQIQVGKFEIRITLTTEQAADFMNLFQTYFIE